MLWDPDGYEPWGHTESGSTQYSDSGNGTVANTYTGDSYGVDSSNGYQPSKDTYGKAVKTQDIAGPEGKGTEAITKYNSIAGTWDVTSYGRYLGENIKGYAVIVDVAADKRSYLQRGEVRSASGKVNLVDLMLAFLGLNKLKGLLELKTVGKQPVAPSLNVAPNIHTGQQGKHTPGHNNFEPGRSTINSDVNPQQLLDGALNGQYPVIGVGSRGDPVVNFGQPIGIDAASGLPTQFGTIHSGNKGSHIVPASPNKYGGQN